jgi:hypothetical protein
MSKRFPFSKRSIEAHSPHDVSSKSREAEDSDADCIGLKLKVRKRGRKIFQHVHIHCFDLYIFHHNPYLWIA